MDCNLWTELYAALQVVEMARDVVSTVEEAQRHAQVLLAQSNVLQVQMQAKAEEVMQVRLEVGTLREQLTQREEAHRHLNEQLAVAERDRGAMEVTHPSSRRTTS
eukprot:3752825-Pyramimonas_sp.AAC.2